MDHRHPRRRHHPRHPGRQGRRQAQRRLHRRGKQRYACYNAGHVPDIIWHGASHSGSHILFEVKVFTPFHSKIDNGNGSQPHGGAPSHLEGHHLAFGNIEEHLLKTILGTKQRGRPDQPPLNHSTGYGYVAPHAGHYADGIAKGNQVIPLISKILGGISKPAVDILYRLHTKVSPTAAQDLSLIHI